MSVEQWMKKNPVACLPEDNLSAAAAIMWGHDCGFVPVVDRDRRIVGVITDRDICMCAFTRGLDLESLRIQDAMSQRVWSCRPTDTLETVEEQMMTGQVRRLPVVDDDGRLVGVLSLSDLARSATSRRRKQSQGSLLPSHVDLGHLVCSLSQPPTAAAAGRRARSRASHVSEGEHPGRMLHGDPWIGREGVDRPPAVEAPDP